MSQQDDNMLEEYDEYLTNDQMVLRDVIDILLEASDKAKKSIDTGEGSKFREKIYNGIQELRLNKLRDMVTTHDGRLTLMEWKSVQFYSKKLYELCSNGQKLFLDEFMRGFEMFSENN